MSLKLATKIVQGVLGLAFVDALPFVKTAGNSRGRKERVAEIKVLAAEKIPSLSDDELSRALEVYR